MKYVDDEKNVANKDGSINKTFLNLMVSGGKSNLYIDEEGNKKNAYMYSENKDEDGIFKGINIRRYDKNSGLPQLYYSYDEKNKIGLIKKGEK